MRIFSLCLDCSVRFNAGEYSNIEMMCVESVCPICRSNKLAKLPPMSQEAMHQRNMAIIQHGYSLHSCRLCETELFALHDEPRLWLYGICAACEPEWNTELEGEQQCKE